MRPEFGVHVLSYYWLLTCGFSKTVKHRETQMHQPLASILSLNHTNLDGTKKRQANTQLKMNLLQGIQDQHCPEELDTAKAEFDHRIVKAHCGEVKSCGRSFQSPSLGLLLFYQTVWPHLGFLREELSFKAYCSVEVVFGMGGKFDDPQRTNAPSFSFLTDVLHETWAGDP